MHVCFHFDAALAAPLAAIQFLAMHFLPSSEQLSKLGTCAIELARLSISLPSNATLVASDFTPLSNLPNLRDLHVWRKVNLNAPCVTAESIAAIGKLTELTSLRLPDMILEVPTIADAKQALAPLAKLKNLKRAAFGGVPFLSSLTNLTDLDDGVSELTELNVLQVRKLKKLRDVAVVNFIIDEQTADRAQAQKSATHARIAISDIESCQAVQAFRLDSQTIELLQPIKIVHFALKP